MLVAAGVPVGRCSYAVATGQPAVSLFTKLREVTLVSSMRDLKECS